jgi:hypothetical protein
VWIHLARGTIRARGVSRGVDSDEGMPWRVGYDLSWDHRWRFRRARVQTPNVERLVERHDSRGWTIDGEPRPDLDDCVDLDLQVSLLTNTAPVHRLGGHASSFPAPAVYLTSALEVVRIDQTYRRLPGPSLRFDYDSPQHGYRAILSFAPDGFVVDYPFIGRRMGEAVGGAAEASR